MALILSMLILPLLFIFSWWQLRPSTGNPSLSFALSKVWPFLFPLPLLHGGPSHHHISPALLWKSLNRSLYFYPCHPRVNSSPSLSKRDPFQRPPMNPMYVIFFYINMLITLIYKIDNFTDRRFILCIQLSNLGIGCFSFLTENLHLST